MKDLNKRQVVLMALVLELFLGCCFLIWAWWRGYSDLIWPSRTVIYLSILFTLPLAAFNFLLFFLVQRKILKMREFSSFINQVVKPLADVLDGPSGLLVALFAGVGEELFFRGVLQNEFGLVFASVAFGLLHFGTAVRQYPIVALLYILIGFYLGLVYQCSHTLWVPLLVHFIYDFAAILYLKYCCQVQR